MIIFFFLSIIESQLATDQICGQSYAVLLGETDR